MDSLELTSIEELVRRHAPELLPHADLGPRAFLEFAALLLTTTIGVVFLAAAGAGEPLNLILAVAGGFVAAIATRLTLRRRHQQFSRELQASPWIYYEAVARNFASEVVRQRTRTIGPDSEWGRARAGLEHAAQEADRSVAYWTQRLATESDSDIAEAQLAAATRLRDKFQTALSGLDQRARVLVSFFNDCEARVAVLRSAKRDYEEIRKLEGLAARSDEVVANAEATLASIGASFVSQALRVANALGGLERAGLVTLAGDVHVDQIETLADKILESAERDRTAVERVAAAI